MLAIIVALWLLVFVPAWFQRSNETQSERGQLRQVSRQLRTEVRANLHREKREHLVVQETRSAAPRVRVSGRAHTVAAQIFRLRALRRALAITLTVAMLAAVASVSLLSTSASYWMGIAGSAVVVGLAAWGLRAVGDRLAVALDASLALRGSAIDALQYSTRVAAAEAALASEPVNPRAWTATELPAPKSNIGTIVETSFAEVISIAPAVAEAAADAPVEQQLDLDSILQRRRQVG